ncbi:MAG: hypothetical protein QXH07_03655 [Thermoplasmata archaeon]
MAQPLSYYQNQIFNNSLNAITNTMAQVPIGIFGSLVAYDNINDWLKISINNTQTTINVNINVVNSVNLTGTINTILNGTNITENIFTVNPLFTITGNVNTQIVGSNITANVDVVGPVDSLGYVNMDIVSSQLSGYVNVNILSNNVTSNVAVINTPNIYLVGSNITQNVNVVNALTITGDVNTQIVGSNITANVNVVGPVDSSGYIKVDIANSSLTGTIDASIINNNVTSNVAIVGMGYRQQNLFTNAFITTNSQTIISTINYQDMVVDVVYGGVITGSIWTGIYSVDPQSNILTSLITSGITATSNTLTVQRLNIIGPLNTDVAIVVNTTPSTQVTGVYITVEQSVGS